MKLLINKIIVFCVLLNIYLISFGAQSKLTNVIIPFSPGGGTDLVFRIFERYCNTRNIDLKSQYKHGAGGLIGTLHVTSDSSGTLLGITSAHTIVEIQKMPIFEGYEYIGQLATPAMALVSSQKANIKSYDDFLNAIKNKSQLSFGYSSPAHRTNILQLIQKIDKNYEPLLVPFNGGSPIVNNLLGNHIDIGFVPVGIVINYVELNKLNLLATTTKIDIKTVVLQEKYQDWINSDGYILFMPKTANKETIKFWKNVVSNFIQDKDSIQLLKKEHLSVTTNTKLNMDSKN
jgi:tripartite-type tricarboxylate transporter receptor subunit TctC